MANLGPLASAHLAAAHASVHGKSAELLVHDGNLRQSVVALVAGTALNEHSSPPAGTLQVLQGRIRVTEGEAATELATGDLWPLTHARHAVVADEDSVFLLTAVTGVDRVG
ncbi:cupin [Xylanimonas sp. McL0601]|uniref:cupin n=1 Tax=Xylanimonas sp. McL0601 TaxID=3414739 RepID=UPI003CF6B55A